DRRLTTANTRLNYVKSLSPGPFPGGRTYGGRVPVEEVLENRLLPLTQVQFSPRRAHIACICAAQESRSPARGKVRRIFARFRWPFWLRPAIGVPGGVGAPLAGLADPLRGRPTAVACMIAVPWRNTITRTPDSIPPITPRSHERASRLPPVPS